MVQFSFDILFNNRTQKIILSANKFLEKRILIFRLCLSDNPKWIFRIDTLLEADFKSPATYFKFGCLYRSPIGDSLTNTISKCRRLVLKKLSRFDRTRVF